MLLVQTETKRSMATFHDESRPRKRECDMDVEQVSHNSSQCRNLETRPKQQGKRSQSWWLKKWVQKRIELLCTKKSTRKLVKIEFCLSSMIDMFRERDQTRPSSKSTALMPSRPASASGNAQKSASSRFGPSRAKLTFALPSAKAPSSVHSPRALTPSPLDELALLSGIELGSFHSILPGIRGNLNVFCSATKAVGGCIGYVCCSCFWSTNYSFFCGIPDSERGL